MSDIDFTKVKKSPVPASATDVVQYFRGDGIKILVLESGAMQVRNIETDSVIAHREGQYRDTPTGEIKKLAAAMLNKAEQDANPPFTEIGHTHPVAEPCDHSSAVKCLTHVKPPKRTGTLDFLMSGRTVLA